MAKRTVKSKNENVDNIFDALVLLEKEKGISKVYMLEKVEAALISAFKSEYGFSKDSKEINVRVAFDESKKSMHIYQIKTVVADTSDVIVVRQQAAEHSDDGTAESGENAETAPRIITRPFDPRRDITLDDAKLINRHAEIGTMIEIEVSPDKFRRLATHAGKQVIIQAIREAEKGATAERYLEKKDGIITCEVINIDADGNVEVNTDYAKDKDKLSSFDFDGSRHILSKKECIPGENFEIGQKIKVLVTEVRRDETTGPVITLSRAHNLLLKRLFELEVPEIADGTVIIKNLVREPGSRSKISVMSRDENVDAVGACIGNHGMRSNNIVDELDGEKIDVIAYSDDPEEYIKAALSPARVNSVTLKDGERACTVIVDSDQLSLAIGRDGQNVRLAAKLTGYKIDIKVD